MSIRRFTLRHLLWLAGGAVILAAVAMPDDLPPAGAEEPTALEWESRDPWQAAPELLREHCGAPAGLIESANIRDPERCIAALVRVLHRVWMTSAGLTFDIQDLRRDFEREQCERFIGQQEFIDCNKKWEEKWLR